MPSVHISLLSRKNCTKKGSLNSYQTSPTFDLEFYKYKFSTSILHNQFNYFLDGVFYVLTNSTRFKAFKINASAFPLFAYIKYFSEVFSYKISCSLIF